MDVSAVADVAWCVQISVDGDTSTNDTVIGLASGAAGNALISNPSSPEAKQLEDAVTALLQACARTCPSTPAPPHALSCNAMRSRTDCIYTSDPASLICMQWHVVRPWLLCCCAASDLAADAMMARVQQAAGILSCCWQCTRGPSEGGSPCITGVGEVDSVGWGGGDVPDGGAGVWSGHQRGRARNLQERGRVLPGQGCRVRPRPQLGPHRLRRRVRDPVFMQRSGFSSLPPPPDVFSTWRREAAVPWVCCRLSRSPPYAGPPSACIRWHAGPPS